MSAGTLFAFALYLSNFFDPVQQLAALQHLLLRDRRTRQDRRSARRAAGRGRPDAIELPRIEGHVRFDGVRFGYGPDFPEVLHGLDLEIRGDDGRARRAQASPRSPSDRPLLRPQRGHDLDRRPGRAPRHTALAPPPARDRARRASCSAAPWPRTSRSRVPRHPMRRSRPRPRWSARTASSPSSRMATTPARERGTRLSLGQRQLVAFARSSPTPGSSSSTKPPRRWTSAPSARSGAVAAARRPDCIRDRAPALRRSATQASSSCSSTAASSSRARTRS